MVALKGPLDELGPAGNNLRPTLTVLAPERKALSVALAVSLDRLANSRQRQLFSHEATKQVAGLRIPQLNDRHGHHTQWCEDQTSFSRTIAET
jgi:hypothetical protein